MPPVTRRRSRMLDDATAEGDSSPRRGNPNLSSPSTTTRKKPLATRAHKGVEEGIAEAGSDEDVASSELRQRVLIEADLLHRKSKRPRSGSVPDSQEGSEPCRDGYFDHDDHDDDVPPQPQSASKQLEEEATRHLASQSSGASLPPLGASEAHDPQKDGKRKHVVFGDDNDVEKYVAAATMGTAAPKQNNEEHGHDNDDDDDDDNCDDDEAPEAVSTKVAARETLESAKAVADAAQKHAASLKRKRQERDELFKKQAEKRKRVPEPDAVPPVPTESMVDAAATALGTGRRRADKAKLPSVLPAEYLIDSPSESEDEAVLRKVVKSKSKKINFDNAARSLDKDQRAPRDQVLGSTVYRVVADHADKRLAPKMHKDTRHVKEALLKRRRAAVTPNKSKGFFVRK